MSVEDEILRQGIRRVVRVVQAGQTAPDRGGQVRAAELAPRRAQASASYDEVADGGTWQDLIWNGTGWGG